MQNLSLTKKESASRLYVTANNAAKTLDISRRSFYRISHNFTAYLFFGKNSDKRYSVAELKQWADDNKIPAPK